MRGKHPELFRLLIIFGLFLLVVGFMTKVPALNGIGRGNIERATVMLQSEPKDSISVTGSPFSLPDYMWDIETKDGEVIDLRPFISSVATIVPGILDYSGIRIRVGKTDKSYNLNIHWDTTSSNNLLGITFLDSLEHPLFYWQNTSGRADITLSGGLYKLVVSTKERLGDDFILTVQATETSELPQFTSTNSSGIPTLDITMSDAMFRSWDTQRAAILKTMETRNTVETADFKRVLASLETNGGQSSAQLWAAGLGDPVHFSPDTPSFTGKVISGQLLFGMSQFKLYSIRTQEGLLNHVIWSIMSDEGIFVPRFLLVRVALNNNNLGLYLLVETSGSSGFFSGVQRYDSQVISMGVPVTDSLAGTGMTKLRAIDEDEEFSLALASKVNTTAFAKTLAFLSRFQAAHSTQQTDFRMFRDPYLDSPEPIIRDSNAIILSNKQTLLAQTSWWLGIHLIGGGSFLNPKTFPTDNPVGSYTITPWAIPSASVHPAVYQFARVPQNRELLDQYLAYAIDEAFQRRFASRIQSAYEAARPFLSTLKIPIIHGNTTQLYRDFDSELAWIRHQVNSVVSEELIVPKTIPILMKTSSLLVSLDPASAPGTKTLTLYNLSPFSARFKLPSYVHIADAFQGDRRSDDPDGQYIPPSLIFPTVVPILIPSTIDVPGKYLTEEAAERLLALERVRLQSVSDTRQNSAPFIDIIIPADQLDDFLSILRRDSIVKLASVYPLPASRNILLSDLPSSEKPMPQAKPTLGINLDFDDNTFSTANITVKDSPFPQKTLGVLGSGVMFDGNTSFVRTGLDVSSWPSLTISLWLKVDPKQAESPAVILDFNHTADNNCVIQLGSTSDPNKAILYWISAGKAVTQEIPTNQWIFVVATANRLTRETQLFVNGELAWAQELTSEPFGKGAILTIGKWNSGPGRYFRGVIDELLVSPKTIAELKEQLEKQATNVSGLLPPDIVILPLSLEQVGGKHRLSLLISNISQHEIALDFARLRWVGAPVPLSPNDPQLRDIPYSIHSIWQIGKNPIQLESPQITLGMTSLSGLSQTGSAMSWTSGFQGVLAGPSDNTKSNTVLIEIDLDGGDARWIQTDGHGLAQSASAQGIQNKIVLHEPVYVYLPQEILEKYKEYQSPRTSVIISVSSFNQPNEGKGSLIDNNPSSYWHVQYPPKSNVHWVTFDFGDPVNIDGLAILPRSGFIDQLWDQDHAVLQGSNHMSGEKDWTSIRRLFIDKVALKTQQPNWLRFTMPNKTAFRYYRIFIDDPSFLSIAEVKFKAQEREKSAVQLTLPDIVKQGVLEIDSTKTIRFKNKDAIISGIITVPSGYTLEIQAGSNLRFTDNAGILSYSPIRAIGTADNPITLSPAEGSKNWHGIAVVNAAGTNEFSYVKMSKAAAGVFGNAQFTGGLTFMNSVVEIKDSEFLNFTSTDGLHLAYTNFTIDGLVMTNSFGDTIDIDWGRGTINNLHVINSGGDGVDTSGSNVVITNSLIEGSADKGVSVGENSVVTVSKCRLVNGVKGIAAKDQSVVKVFDTEISGNQWGALQYIKKPIYTYPDLQLVNCNVHDNKTNIYREKPDVVTRQFDQGN